MPDVKNVVWFALVFILLAFAVSRPASAFPCSHIYTQNGVMPTRCSNLLQIGFFAFSGNVLLLHFSELKTKTFSAAVVQ